MCRTNLAVAVSLFLFSACRQPEMRDQPKFEVFERTEFFKNETSARKPVAGTLPLLAGRRTFRGTALQRGRDRFRIFCTPCHGEDGRGNGPVVQRGFTAPPSLHAQAVQQANLEHIFRVITEGKGMMHGYGGQIPEDDRLLIAQYVKSWGKPR